MKRPVKKQPATKTPMAKQEERRLVLIADDNEDNREMYAEYLSFVGFRTMVATTGMEAVALAEAECPDVIAMDLSMPVMDGWEAVRRLRANPKTRHICIIALTGHAEPTYVQQAKDAGCDGFIAKPCLPPELAKEIDRCWRDRSTDGT